MRTTILAVLISAIAIATNSLPFINTRTEIQASCVPITDPQGGNTCRP